MGTDKRQAVERKKSQERRYSDDRRGSVVDRRLGLDRRRGPGRRRSDDRRSAPATFHILVDGQHLAVQEVGRSEPRVFYHVTHPVPAEMVRGKVQVTVRFEAQEGSRIATIYGVRMVRAEQVG